MPCGSAISAELGEYDDAASRHRQEEAAPERARWAPFEDPPARQAHHDRRVVAEQRRDRGLRAEDRGVPQRQIEGEEGAASHREERGRALERPGAAAPDAPWNQD